MTVVVRLEGLNIEAGSQDIRLFFDGLHIPDGGVHIIGGRLGEAFIIFASEKDAQLAMRRSGSFLRGSRVTLFLSSKTELQNKMASSLKRYRYSKKGPERKPEDLAQSCASDTATAFLLGLVSAMGGLHAKQGESNAVSPMKSVQPTSMHTAAPEERQKRKSVSPRRGSRYLRLHGLPKSVTRYDVRQFFEGLRIQDVLVDVRVGGCYCCMVEFPTEREALEGLKYNGKHMGSHCVKVRETSENTWLSVVGECKKSLSESKRSVSPLLHRRSLEERSRSRSPKRSLSYSCSPSNEFCVILQNLSPRATKTEIKELFGCSHLPRNQVLHLLDSMGNRTSTAFVVFDDANDYYSAMKLNGSKFGSRSIQVSAISKEKMAAMIRASKFPPGTDVDRAVDEQPINEKSRNGSSSSSSSQGYMYVRNLPADVRKVEVRDFFCKFPVSENCITLLHDREGGGIGEALVRFSSENTARMAESLHGQRFLGTRVLLTRITRQQMEDLLRKTR